MILTGIARLGRDAELRYLQDGGAVASLALAFNYGKKGDNRNRESQWVEAALWGKQAEGLAQYLVKGTQLSLVISDPHIETYDKREGGQGFKMVGRIINIEFAGSAQRQNETPRHDPPNQQQSGYKTPFEIAANSRQPVNLPSDNFDDDIPF